MSARLMLILGALNGFLAVAAGAAGAHVLADLPPHRLDLFHTAVTYHGLHALALLAAALLAHTALGSARWLRLAGWAFLAGILLFSGGLYVLALTGAGMAALIPIGGLSFMAGWLCLAVAGIAA